MIDINCVDCKREMEDEFYLTLQIGEDNGMPLLEADIPLCVQCIAIRAFQAAHEKKRKKLR